MLRVPAAPQPSVARIPVAERGSASMLWSRLSERSRASVLRLQRGGVLRTPSPAFCACWVQGGGFPRTPRSSKHLAESCICPPPPPPEPAGFSSSPRSPPSFPASRGRLTGCAVAAPRNLGQGPVGVVLGEPPVVDSDSGVLGEKDGSRPGEL